MWDKEKKQREGWSKKNTRKSLGIRVQEGVQELPSPTSPQENRSPRSGQYSDVDMRPLP